MSRTRLAAHFWRTAVFLLALCGATTAWSLPVAEGIVTRTLALSDLGLSQHISLSSRNFEQHFYFPVPQGVALKDAHFEIHGTYLHPFAEAAAVTLLVNGAPAFTHRLPDSDGKSSSQEIRDKQEDAIDISLPLSELPAQGGFLDLGIVLNSQLDATHCIDERGRGNELSIDTKATQLSYSFKSDSVQSIRSLLTTLPHRPVILLPRQELNATQYDTALRLSLALAGMGLQPEFAAVPQVGDVVDTLPLAEAAKTADIQIPDAMASSIKQRRPYKITQPVEAAIWLALRMMSPEGLAQAVIDPAQSRQSLLSLLQGVDKDSSLGAQLWYALRLDEAGDWLPAAKMDKANVRIAMLAGQAVLALDGADMLKGVDLVATSWRQIAGSRELALDTALHLSDKDTPLPHIHFASTLPVQNVADSAEWVVPIQLSQLPRGKWPDSFELNLMAAPSGDGSPPVVSVLMNDNLLTAMSLRTDGEITRLRAHIPLYAIRANNMLRVEIRRRISGGHCSGVVQSFPVQLLPSSYLTLRNAQKATQFFMLGTKFSRDSEVAIPARYLHDAANTLPVISAVLRGLSVGEKDFRLVPGANPGFKPSHTFVAFESAPASDTQLVTAGNGRLIVRNKRNREMFDSAGLGSLAVLQLIRSGHQDGISVITVDGTLPALRKPLELSSGNLAVSDATGVRLAVDLDGADNDWQLDEQNRSPQAFVWRYRAWLFVLFLILLPVTAVLGLRWYFRNRKSGD